MSARRAHLLLKLFTAVCLGITFVVTVFLAWSAGPYVERWALGPVVSKLRILSVEEMDNGHSRLTAEFNKIRDCEYVGIAWFKGSPSGGFERVPVVLMREEGDTSSPNRPLGLQRAGPWEIHLDPDSVRSNSFALLFHRCHGLWLTTTDFWP